MAYVLVCDEPDPRLERRLRERGSVRVAAGDQGPGVPGPGDRVLLFHPDDHRVSGWLRALRRGPETALIAVAVAESPDPDRAGEDGRFADGSWPLGGSEAALARLLDRLDAVADRVAALSAVPAEAGMEGRSVALLRYLVTRQLDMLDPVRHPAAAKGYNLPLAGLVLDLPRGEEFDLCEELAGLGLFEREFRDRIHLCPHCGHYAINFREVCPTCRSARLRVVPNVHHYRCGHVAPESDFQEGEDLVCPKCRRVLRHVGVDFDRPNQVVRCEECGAVTPEPEVECLSLVCGRVFPPDLARRFDVPAYRLTARGAAAAESGRLPPRSLLDLLHEQFNTVPEDAFEDMVRLARHLSDRYGRPYALAEIEVPGREQLLEAVGPVETLRVLQTVVEILRGSLRETDVVCPLSESRFRVLLFETPGPGARRALARARDEVAARLPDLPVELRLSWPEDRS